MPVSAGLCADCSNVKVMRSDRDSVFYLCQLSFTDSRFPKYPALPVLRSIVCESMAPTSRPSSASFLPLRDGCSAPERPGYPVDRVSGTASYRPL